MEQLNEIKKLIDAEKSDVFDVLAYVAYALAPVTREDRVSRHRNLIHSDYSDKQKAFLDFVLEQYVKEGVGELQPEKISSFLELKYGGIHDAVDHLGDASSIRELFVAFQKHLYRAA